MYVIRPSAVTGPNSSARPNTPFSSLVNSATVLLSAMKNPSPESLLLFQLLERYRDTLEPTPGFTNDLNSFCIEQYPHTWKPSKTRKNIPSCLNRKRERRLQYGHIQRLYHTRRKDAASTVLDGRWQTAHANQGKREPNFNSHWVNILQPSPVVDSRPAVTLIAENEALVVPISRDETSSALRNLQGCAAGVDRITVAHLRRLSCSYLTAFLNCLLASCPFPAHMNVARITFVPKFPEASAPGDFRPISVTSVFTRLLHKILAGRWLPSFPADKQQFGFVKKDGSFEAPTILHACLRHANSNSRSLSLALLDISKAFDLISQDSLIRAATTFGAPSFLRSHLSSYYQTAVSRIDDTLIHPDRGVRQGDPLSPLLFIMALDEALRNISCFGWDSPGGMIDYLAYADDIILFGQDRENLSARLNELSIALQHIGLNLNHLKSKVIDIMADGKRKIAVLNPSPLHTDSVSFESLQTNEPFKFLGLPFTWKGKLLTASPSSIRAALREITRAPLKPYQRLDLLRSFLLPRHIHSLSLAVVHKGTLKKIDLSVRACVRQWLRLPSDVTTAFLHANITDGGLGIPNTSTQIPLLRRARLEHHLSSPNPILRWALQDSTAAPIHRLACQPIYASGSPVTDKATAKAAWKDALLRSSDGAPLLSAKTTDLSHLWLRDSRRVFPRLFIRGIQLRAGVLATKVRSARRLPAGTTTDLSCRGNCGQPESISHILQSCAITHDARCKRHNDLARLVARKGRRHRLHILEEPIIHAGESFIKPDLIVIKETKALLMDVAICGAHRMLQSYQLKIDKYSSHESAINNFLHLTEPLVSSVSHHPIIINNRGFIHTSSQKSLLALGFTKLDISDLCLATIQGCLRTYDSYMRGT